MVENKSALGTYLLVFGIRNKPLSCFDIGNIFQSSVFVGDHVLEINFLGRCLAFVSDDVMKDTHILLRVSLGILLEISMLEPEYPDYCRSKGVNA